MHCIVMEGKEEFRSGNGQVFVGDYKGDLKDGKGKLTMADGT